MADSALPPELVSAVFGNVQLKELLPLRLVDSTWKELVDTEAKLRMLELAQNPDFPLVLQAGPPALYDVCEFLPLSFESFVRPVDVSASRAHEHAVVARLGVTHSAHNPSHASSMAADEDAVFSNLVLSITRLERRRSYEPSKTGASGAIAFGNWPNWELARETDRLWREWWDDAPSSPSSFVEADEASPSSFASTSSSYSSSSSSSAGSGAGSSDGTNDSGFDEGGWGAGILGCSPEQIAHKLSSSRRTAPSGRTCEKCIQVGKVIKRATLDLNVAQTDPPTHEYRWRSVELDVFKVLLAFEERNRRSGISATLRMALAI